MDANQLNERKCIDMIWANESGVSVYIYESQHGRREIEIHGVVNNYETVLATATIEKHNLRRVMVAFTPPLADFVEKYNINDEDLAELSKIKPPIQSGD